MSWMASSSPTTTEFEALRRFFIDPVPSKTAVRFDPFFRPSLHREARVIPLSAGTEFLVNRNGGALMHDGRLVGSIGRLNELTIVREFRGKGLAVEMVVAWATTHPTYWPRWQAVRSRHGAATYRAAWTVLEPIYRAMIC